MSSEKIRNEVLIMDEQTSGFPENIRKLRKQHNMTQQDLAEKIGVTGKAVSKWEVGATRPNSRTVLKLAKLFKVHISDLEYGYVAENSFPDNNMEQIISFMNEINKKIERLISNRDVVSDYLKNTSKYEMDTIYEYYDEDPMTEEEMDFQDVRKYYEDELYDYLDQFDFDKALDLCDELIDDGFGEIASDAIYVCDREKLYLDYANSPEELICILEKRKKYAKIYIHHLMKKYGVSKDELIG